VLVPLVLAILAIALYPQFALKRSQPTVTSIVPTAEGVASGSTRPEP
jgi:NADH:ubiquinone oxidoreductase subunit 4 (subunit M)